jgi:hypothetical protein
MRCAFPPYGTGEEGRVSDGVKDIRAFAIQHDQAEPSGKGPGIRALLADPESEDIEFEPSRHGDELPSVHPCPSCLRGETTGE